MSATTGKWIDNGSGLRVRFKEEQGHLVKEWDQPDRGLILSDNAEQKKNKGKRFLGGWKVGSIPLFDYHRIVLPKYPELECDDKQLRDRAIVRLCNDPEMEPYVIRKA